MIEMTSLCYESKINNIMDLFFVKLCGFSSQM